MSDELNNTPQLDEPSVLDYVKSLFRFGRGEQIQISDFVEEEQESRQSAVINEQLSVIGEPLIEKAEETPEQLSTVSAQTEQVRVPTPQPVYKPQEELPPPYHPPAPFPWRSLLALMLALVGQNAFEPPVTSSLSGYAFYITALSMLGWAVYRGEWKLAPLPQSSTAIDPLTYRRLPLFLSLGLWLWGFTIFGNNLFTTTNVMVWCFAMAFFIWSLWLNQEDLRSTWKNTKAFVQRGQWTITISPWTLLLIFATLVLFFFRFYRTTTVPPEPFSDHAEKLLDVYDVSQGQTHIFFIRNTGREAFQMYWTLLIAKVFGMGLSFFSLKLGTAILGFLTLPFIYLLGKEVGGKRVGLLAFILVGIGYWPNVISRVGLRFPLYPLFVAPTLFYLIRGLRTHNRNDFLLSGLFLGIGLHGYSPFRIVPLVVIAAFILYWLHAQSKGVRRESIAWLAMLGLASLFVFLPLLRYWYDEPGVFSFRAFTRLSGVEQPLPGPVWQIFLSNTWNALKMFNIDDGVIWVHSVPDRPALDRVSAALFVLGILLVIIRYIRNHHWLDLFLLLSIPLLLLPSILSLAFPDENPALNRAGGAYIPAFVIAAIAFDGLLTSFGRGAMRSLLMWAVAGILLYVSAVQNYDLTFNQYYTLFRNSSWNTSDMGKVIKEFELTYGTVDNVWVVPFPYWVDTRLPAVWAGIPNRDLAMWRENLASTLELKNPKLFIVKADLDNPDVNDEESLDLLKKLYPNGQLRMFDSDVPGHDFWIFTVPQ
jgi:hypothetical protein